MLFKEFFKLVVREKDFLNMGNGNFIKLVSLSYYNF